MKTFEEYFVAASRRTTITPRPLELGECQSPSGRRCELCFAVNLSYVDEVRFKKIALQEYWHAHFPKTPLSSLVTSQRNRLYRTVTKRKAFPSRGKTALGFVGPMEHGSSKAFEVVRCAIEPADHAGMYARITEALNKSYATPLADRLTYVIIKGSYTEFAVIFNVRDASAAVIKAANTLSKSLTHAFPLVLGVFVYEDSSSDGYYLGSKNPRRVQTIKKLFGKSEIYQKLLEKSFLYSPLSFSQINPSVSEAMVLKAGELLQAGTQATLFDLYCGYGLFSLTLANSVKRVIGVELSPHSVESAVANAKRQGVNNVKFIRSSITAESLQTAMKHSSPDDMVLLDPPRGGTAEGVIELIAARHPSKIIHIFCNVDLMPAEIHRWETSGYSITSATPFDMFPGTSSMEIMVAFERK